jgi:hypothetical protein
MGKSDELEKCNTTSQQNYWSHKNPSGCGREKGTRLGRSFSLAHAPATSESIAAKEVRFLLQK